MTLDTQIAATNAALATASAQKQRADAAEAALAAEQGVSAGLAAQVRRLRAELAAERERAAEVSVDAINSEVARVIAAAGVPPVAHAPNPTCPGAAPRATDKAHPWADLKLR